jgi:predicted nuclease of predicted toxin-antitoxin system
LRVSYAERFSEKKKFLLDEHLDKTCSKCLEKLGYRTVTVQEIGLGSKQDEEIIAFARKEKFVLVSSDNGFMNNRSHPLPQCAELILIPAISSKNDVSKWMPRIDHVTGIGDLNGCKIQLHDNYFSKTYICIPCGGAIKKDEVPYNNCEFCKGLEKKLRSDSLF